MLCLCLSPPGTRLHRSATAAPPLLPIDSIEKSPPFPLPAAINPSLFLTAAASSSPRTAADSAPRLRAAVLGCPSGPSPSTRNSRPISFRWGPRRSAGMATGARDGSTQLRGSFFGGYVRASRTCFFVLPTYRSQNLAPAGHNLPHTRTFFSATLQTPRAFFFT